MVNLKIYLRNLFYLLFYDYCFFATKPSTKSPEQMIQESIAQYPGKCPCPYSVMSNGKKMGKEVHIPSLVDISHYVIYLIL